MGYPARVVRHASLKLASKIALPLIVAVATVAAATASAAVQSASKIFYLDLKVGQCARGVLTHKTLLRVPCSDPLHNIEIFAALHGGWKRGEQPAHPVVYTRARTLCLASFRHRFGHPIAAPYGWRAFWPDPGKEETKYGDRLICGLVRYPTSVAMGAGTHFH